MTAPTLLSADDQLTRFVGLMDVVATFYRANLNNPKKPMDISREDVTELFRSLNQHHVQYLLVGGMATALHGYVRATEDLDLWIRVGNENKAGLITALEENDVAGAIYLKDVPLLFGWTSVVAGKRGFTLDMGHALKAFSELDFDACYERAVDASFDGVPFKVIHLNDLITEKRATGRPKDQIDVDELTKLTKRNTDSTDETD
ncbi:nucleotidyltransferase [Spirosoma montaniterrae]|nr:nucleotidyltransferase [Spirosoma montaniterrae]